jgi:hypothetical protein
MTTFKSCKINSLEGHYSQNNKKSKYISSRGDYFKKKKISLIEM